MVDDKQKKLQELVNNFNNALQAACDYADETEQSFSIYPSRGMGGVYDPADDNGDEYSEGDGWFPSSRGC